MTKIRRAKRAMKIRKVVHNNRKRAFEVTISRKTLLYPYARCAPAPEAGNRVAELCIDKELSEEGFSYSLESGDEGTVHAEQVLDYNKDPAYLAELLLYKLTLEARKRLNFSPLSKREIIRRLGTSPAQFYRLFDQTNYKKSIGQMLELLHVLDCQVDLVVRSRQTS